MTQPDPEEQPDTLSIDFIKSNLFRVIYADGIWGGIGPHGFIQMALYSDRTPIPKRVDFKFQQGILGDEISREGRPGIVREIEAEVLISRQTAISLRDWLTQKIEETGG